jgi:prepilin-type N-terminal cleavage/methylation domain-containing protein/prepilin-type processing-associated H-X9-DG protein
MPPIIDSLRKESCSLGNGHSDSNSRNRGFSVVELLIASVIVSILCLLAVKISGAMSTQTKTAICSHNLRQIWVAIKLYADDHNGALPGPSYQAITYASPSVPQLLISYTGGNDRIWDCPARPVLRDYKRTGYLQGLYRDETGTSRQFFGYPERGATPESPSVKFVTLSQITNPSYKWLLMDADAASGSLPADIAKIAPDAPHNKKRNALMLDGTVAPNP